MTRVFVCGVNPQQIAKFFVESRQNFLTLTSEVELTDHLDATVDVLLCIDWVKGSQKYVTQAKKIGIPTVLVVNEPSVVIPEHNLRSIRRLFEHVIEVGRPYAEPLIHWPQAWPKDFHPNRFDCERTGVVMVQAAKNSFVKGQLYSLRAQLASSDSRVDLFGFGWDTTIQRKAALLLVELYRAVRGGAHIDLSCLKAAFLKPLSYRGGASEKLKTMSSYKVAVVIENSKELITEKLFDAFFANCIPVYVGPPLENFGIPDHLYVRAEASVESLYSAISRSMALSYENWKIEIHDFLRDKQVQDMWGETEVVSRILQHAISESV